MVLGDYTRFEFFDIVTLHRRTINSLYHTTMSMFGHDGSPKGSEHMDTVIGATVKIEGKFIGKGNVFVHGKVIGSMQTDHNVEVSESANIHADVEADCISIAGEVHGNVKAHNRVELTPTAKLYGDVEAKIVSVGAGAVLNGKCVTITDATPPSADALLKDRAQRNIKNVRQAEAL